MRSDKLGPLDPIFDVDTQYGAVASGNTPGADALTVTINQGTSQGDPAHVSPIVFDVVFSEAVSDFVTGNVAFTGSTAGGTLLGTVVNSGDDIHFTVIVTGMTTDGTVTPFISGGAVHAIATGISNQHSTGTDDTVYWELLACWDDDFNRADGGLGADWSYTVPRLNIVSNVVWSSAFSGGSSALYVGGGGVAPTGVNHAVSGLFYQGVGSAHGRGAPAVRMKADRSEYYEAGYNAAAFGSGDYWYINRVGGAGGNACLAALAAVQPNPQPLALRFQANDIGAAGTLLVLYDVSDPGNPEPILAATDASATDLQHVGFGFTGWNDPVPGLPYISVDEWQGCDSDPDDALYPSPEITGGSAVPYGSSHWITTIDAATYAVSNSGAIANSWTVGTRTGSTPIEWLAVAGGGGGGGVIGGGGGAGGLAMGSTTLTSDQVCSVGAGGNLGNNVGAVPTNGGNTVFGSISGTMIGGGCGAGATGVSTPGSGGSGGGYGSFSSGSGGAGTGGQGNNGGAGGGGGCFGAAGGGGAGAVGQTACAVLPPGNGGDGLPWTAGDGQYYAGGGGGGYYSGPVLPGGVGGLGGGGDGGARNTLYCCAESGTARSGGGGGGGGHNDAGSTGSPYGGNGGTGCIRIKYAR